MVGRPLFWIAARIWVTGGGAKAGTPFVGSAPDAKASTLGLPCGQPQPPRHLSSSQDTANLRGVQPRVSIFQSPFPIANITLKLIDTQDGPVDAMPSPGALLNFALAVTDNDTEVRQQVTYAYLRTPKTTMAPWLGGEGAWNFGIKLEPKWSPLSW